MRNEGVVRNMGAAQGAERLKPFPTVVSTHLSMLYYVAGPAFQDEFDFLQIPL